ncbi:hypothetical protein DAPPUDRAFT_312159 [Daphnia pulex]|uniref:Focal AT domain-containing protein n=1 Tax=Daphnia pulex TaxID=6669 RepID=E9FZ15_DAPPU|nr:hypothetical protein DAPPUDRAFT_312159 [Daphnia pulex]|eukprot:EFX87629.1 hypothetical protein DAPPUDRAFT_312159 [Daphnia pulex]
MVEMAHKVLSKDMAELVSALKLDERCSNTTLGNEIIFIFQGNAVCSPRFGYMNAINLLDLVDHARIKHPHVNEPGTFHENTELHFSHPIQVLHPIVQTARKSRLALL